MDRMKGRVAIVTGAGSGMGAAITKLFIQEGASVAATGRTFSKVEKVVNDIKAELGSDIPLIGLEHRIQSKEDWERVAKTTCETFGRIDTLINNAGILYPTSYDILTHEQWSEVMDINAWGPFLGMQTVIPYIKKEEKGSIVNISSMAVVNSAGAFTAYTASKGAVDAFTRAAAIELAPYDIRVNCILPGTIVTPMVEDAFNTEEAMKVAIAAQPLKRMGKPEDIAYAVCYLASDEAAFTNGVSLLVDGGFNVQASGSTTHVE